MEKYYIKELFKLINKHTYAKITIYEYRDSFPAAFEKAIPELEELKIQHPSWRSSIDSVIENCEVIKSELAGVRKPEFIPGEPHLDPPSIIIDDFGTRVLPTLEDLIWEGQPCTDPELRQGNLYDTYQEAIAEKAKTQPKETQAFDNIFNPLKNFLGEDNGGLFSSFNTLFSSGKNDNADKVSDSAKEVGNQNGGGMKFCPYCGNKLAVSDAKFCPNCGNKIN
ncbi:MAG: zinc ribbon domain-containing protein [Christensenellales bacterium]